MQVSIQKTTTRKQKIEINFEIRYGLCSIQLISRHSPNEKFLILIKYRVP